MIYFGSPLLTVLSLAILPVKTYHFTQDNHLNLAKFISDGRPCLGVLIENDIVLTSGSCAEGIRYGDMVTLKNRSSRGEKLSSYEVVAAIAHPKYTNWFKTSRSKRQEPQLKPVGAKDFDLGIIKIDAKNKKFPVLPIKLALDDELTRVGKDVMAVYWHPKDYRDSSKGLSDFTDYDQKKVLKQGSCKIYGSAMKPNITFCIGHPTDEEGLVEHQAGAPIVSFKNNQVTLLGIYSEGRYDGRNEAPSKITKVLGLSNWIRKVLSEKEFFTRKAANKIGGKYIVDGLKPPTTDAYAQTNKGDLLEMDIPDQS